MKPTCTGPLCAKEARTKGLCLGHYRWSLRHPGQRLVPLRERPAVALELVSLRLEPATRDAVLADLAGARVVLDRWATRRKR